MANLFYTGKGDGGQSNLGGKKIDKTSIEIEAVGLLDEANSLLGLVRTHAMLQPYKEILKEVQENIFIIQAHIGCYMMESEPPDFSEQKIKNTETLIDQFEKEEKPERGCIVSGEIEETAWLDYARAVVRRAEIALVKLARKMEKEGKTLEPNTLAYMNRLSSLLYAMARALAKKHGKEEKH